VLVRAVVRIRLFLALGALLASACAQETIAHQQSEREANRIVKLLRDVGMDADKIKDPESREIRFNIVVPKDAAHEALRILEDHNLPETPKPDTAEIFREGGMIPTSEQERAKRVVGIEGDIVNGLRQLPRVVDVVAAVSIPQDDPLRDVNEEKPKPKISVMVVYQPEGPEGLPPITVEDVQKFVYAKVSDMKVPEVSVLLIPNRNTSKSEAGSVAGLAPAIDPSKGCAEKERVVGIDVCLGNKKKVVNLIFGAVIVAGLLAGMAVVAVLRAMRYRKDLTRLTAQFQNVKK